MQLAQTGSICIFIPHGNENYGVAETLRAPLKEIVTTTETQKQVLRYLEMCPDETYDKIAQEAQMFFTQLVLSEADRSIASLSNKIKEARHKVAFYFPEKLVLRQVNFCFL